MTLLKAGTHISEIIDLKSFLDLDAKHSSFPNERQNSFALAQSKYVI